MKEKIKQYCYLPVYFVIACAVMIIRPLSGEELVGFPWRTMSYIFMLMLVEEGMMKENIFLPLFRVLNSMRSTPFLLFLLILADFIISLFLFDFASVLVMVPFAIRLLEESKKEKYTVSVVAILTLTSGIASVVTPFSTANLPLFLDADISFTGLLKTVFVPFLVSLLLIGAEAFFLFRKTKGDEIYLHIENEDYWDGSRRGMRILYPAFFLVILFGRRFNTIDLLLVVAITFLLLDRKVYGKLNWALFLTLSLMVLSGYALCKTACAENTFVRFLIPVLFTRLGSSAGGIRPSVTLPSALLSFSFPFFFAMKEMKEEKKAFALQYARLALPHILVFIAFSALQS